MNALVSRAPTGAALAAWVDQANQNLAGLPSSGGMDLLKLTKQGQWVFGQAKTPLADDDFVAVNPFSTEVGFIAFSDQGDLLGEHMASLAAPPLRQDQLPPVATPRGWQKQVSFACQIMDGANAGKAVVFKTSSVGGMDFAKKIIAEMMAKIRKSDANCVPVLDLQVESYMHSNKSYGEIFTPAYVITDWIDMNFDPVVDAEPEPAPAPVQATPAARRAPPPPRSAAPAAAAAPAVEPGRRMRRA